MTVRADLSVTCAATALLLGLGLASPVLAADMVTKAPAATPVQWWYEGFVEVGGRMYLNNPDKTKLGKFYEYRDLRPGVFGNFLYGAHRNGPDPLDIEIWGKNVGWDDQAFGLDLAKPGTYYLTLGWDETPHVFGKDAKTTYSGGNILSTPQYTPFPPTATTVTNVTALSRTDDVKYRRDTASGQFRWTPTDNWDITADYSHMHREGTQRLSALTFAPPAGRGGADTRASIELPKPVDDTTQNGNLKAEYAGSTPWGKSFNFALGAGFSFYNNDVGCGSVGGVNGSPGSSNANCVTFQNPWVASPGTATDPFWNRYSLAPDNQAQTISASGGVGLPFNSRYMGTFQYSRMTQDETFMTSTSNPAVVPATLSRGSLGGDARTTLSNNVLNTQILPNLKSTLRYRYYDYHSNQSPVSIAGLFTNPDTNAGATTETTTPVNFTKQTASAELVWRPLKWLNTGAEYEWERDRRQLNGTDVITLATGDFSMATNENAVKVFADADWGWSMLRTSLRYGERRLDGDYINPLSQNNAFRMVDVQNRDSTIAKASWAINVTNSVTVTPVGGYRYDDYQADGRSTFGINEYKSWNAGADIAWTISPLASLYVSYIHDNGHRSVYQNTLPSNLVLDTTDFVDTVIVGAKYTAIPDKLFLHANYTFSRSTSKWASNCGPGGCLFTPMPTFPDTHNTNHRIDAWAKYMLDPTYFRNAGFLAKAQPFVKGRVIWEKNSNDSWQNIDQQLGWLVNPADLTLSRSVFLGISDPNYNVVVGMLSFGLKW